MSEGADQSDAASGESTRSPVDSPADSPRPGDADRIFSGRPPSVGWSPSNDLPPAPRAAAQGGSAAAWFRRGNTAAPRPAGAVAAATTSGEIDIETWLRLSGEADAGAPPRPTWTLSTGQFPVVSTGQFPTVSESRRPSLAARLDPPAEVSYRWRTLLGLAMAVLLTVAVVVAYRGNRGRVSVVEPTGPTAGAPNQAPLSSSSTLTNLPGSPAPTGSITPGGPSGANPTSPGPTGTGTPDGPTVPVPSVDGGPDSTAVDNTAADNAAATGSAVTNGVAGAETAAGAPTTSAAVAAGGGSPAVTPITGPGGTAPVLVAGAEAGEPHPGSVPGGPPPRPGRVSQHVDAAAFKLLGSAEVRAEVAGFDDAGYLAGVMAPGNGATWTVENKGPAAVATLHVRYSAGNDTTVGPRSLTVLIDGTDGPVLRMDPTGDWSSWREAILEVTVPAGHSTMGLVVRAGNTGFVYIDSITLG